MARHVEGKAYAGSQKWLQELVNDHPDLLNAYIAPKLRPQPSNIEWLSPLRSDDFAEYNDNDFVKLLGITLNKRPLSEFWPNRGPHWDALATTDKGQILLVEAKSHIREMVSTTDVKDPANKAMILSSLEETKNSIHRESQSAINWTTGVYQYANRLAHLYLLHKLNNKAAYLVLLYFLNDKERQKPDTYVPSTAEEWKSAIAYQDRLMGIRQKHPLTNRIIHAFIDVRDIEAR